MGKLWIEPEKCWERYLFLKVITHTLKKDKIYIKKKCHLFSPTSIEILLTLFRNSTKIRRNMYSSYIRKIEI